jgi:hypothetical protein
VRNSKVRWPEFQQSRFHKGMVNLLVSIVVGSTAVVAILDGIDWLKGIQPRIPLSFLPVLVLTLAAIPLVVWFIGWIVSSLAETER